MHKIDDKTPVSDLLSIRIGENISYRKVSGTVHQIDFDETNTYWEMIFTLVSTQKIYIRKEKNSC